MSKDDQNNDKESGGIKIVVKNKRAHFDYFLFERFEAGLELRGTEVKSIREGKVKIEDAYIDIDGHGEVWVYNMHVSHYDFGNINNHEVTRKRKLLLQRHQINLIIKDMAIKQYNLIPTMLYFKKSRVKLEFAFAKGKKLHDKRESEAKRDVEKNLRRGNYE